MAATWRNERARKWALQSALVLLLAATLGMAQWYRSARLGKAWVELGAEESFKDLRLRVPVGWEGRFASRGVLLEERGGRGRSRRIHVWPQRCGLMTPLEYLARTGKLPAGAAESGGKLVPVAGWPGMMVGHDSGERDGEAASRELIACTVLPSGYAVTARMEGGGRLPEADEDAMRKVADSIRLEGQQEMSVGAEVMLEGRLKVRAPASLATFGEPWPYRVGWTFVSLSGGEYLVVDVVPVVWAGFEAQHWLPAVMAMRDRDWGGGEFRQLSESAWIYERANERHPAAAFLVVNGSAGLLAEFRWQEASGSETGRQRVEQLWQEISRGAVFPMDEDLDARIERTSQALGSLPGDAAELLRGASALERWEWFHEDAPGVSPELWKFSAGRNHIFAVRAGPTGFAETWSLSRDWKHYLYALSLLGERLQETAFSRGQLTTSTREWDTMMARSNTLSPANYLPGGVLPLALGQLPREPMVFATESVIRNTPSPSTMMLALIVEPATDVRRYPVGGDEPQMAWNVRVNGSSESSRWFIGDDGRVEAIWFEGGLRYQRAADPRPATGPTTVPATVPTTIPATMSSRAVE